VAAPLLEVKDLKVHFPTEDGVVKAVDGVSFTIQQGETLGVVGESGSGKSVTFLTVMGLTNLKTAEVSGEILFRGQDLLRTPADELRNIRGSNISMIFQDPMTSLHPFYKVGDQIVEAIVAHQQLSKRDARDQAVEMLNRVGIPRPKERAAQYPHEFSGGMRQRAMIAMAVALNPDLLIADEPTTALDVTVQAQILDLLGRLKDEFDAAVVIITHDLGVVAEHADNVMVMYAGKPAEYGDRDDVYYRRLRPIPGLPPSLIFVPPGCPFHPRCRYVMPVCKEEVPELLSADGKHASACHLSLAEKERIFEEEVAIKA
jgi:peptide/nickel transport system ATP-binding protein